jgi:crotonobetainyl-CoA:carnitine CoA-transferase CaiB-like acyl-CoA transferase
MTELNYVPCSDGKYTFVFSYNGKPVECLRYGESWRTFDVGDNAISSLCITAHDQCEDIKKLNDRLKKANEKIESMIYDLRHIQAMCGNVDAIKGCQQVVIKADDTILKANLFLQEQDK